MSTFAGFEAQDKDGLTSARNFEATSGHHDGSGRYKKQKVANGYSASNSATSRHLMTTRTKKNGARAIWRKAYGGTEYMMKVQRDHGPGEDVQDTETGLDYETELKGKVKKQDEDKKEDEKKSLIVRLRVNLEPKEKLAAPAKQYPIVSTIVRLANSDEILRLESMDNGLRLRDLGSSMSRMRIRLLKLRSEEIREERIALGAEVERLKKLLTDEELMALRAREKKLIKMNRQDFMESYLRAPPTPDLD